MLEKNQTSQNEIAVKSKQMETKDMRINKL